MGSQWTAVAEEPAQTISDRVRVRRNNGGIFGVVAAPKKFVKLLMSENK